MRWRTPLLALLALVLSAHPGCTRPDTALASLRGSAVAGWRVGGREAWRCDASAQLHATVEHSDGPRGCLRLRGGAGVDALHKSMSLKGGAANAGVDALAGALGDMKVGEGLDGGSSVDPGTEKEDGEDPGAEKADKKEEAAAEKGEEEDQEESEGDRELAKLLAELDEDFEAVGLSDAGVNTPSLTYRLIRSHQERVLY